MNRSALPAVMASCAAIFLAVIYGAVSVHMSWWPSKTVANAGAALQALIATQRQEFQQNWPTSMERFEDTEHRGLTIINHSVESAGKDDLIFVDGGTQQLRSHCPENGCIAWIMDKRGAVKHVWRIGAELIWDDLQNTSGFSRAENIYSVGAHPLPNGDLLVTYQGRNTYPYGVGMARFDKDSNLLWKKENFAHHWFSVDERGYIYVPAFQKLPAPAALGDTPLRINCNGGFVQEDVVLILDPDGNEVDRISILDSLAESGYAGAAFQGIHADRSLPLPYTECDPTHLNDVQIISAADARTSQQLAADDLLVSLRSSNALLTINAKTKQVGWLSVGRTILQHSPHYLGDGTVIAFDNLGGNESQGGSRVVRVNLDTDEHSIVYPRPEDPVSDFLSATAGYISVSDDKQRALVSLTRQGRTLEIDIDEGRVLWEFLNIHDLDGIVADEDGGNHARFATQTVRYFNNAEFKFNIAN